MEDKQSNKSAENHVQELVTATQMVEDARKACDRAGMYVLGVIILAVVAVSGVIVLAIFGEAEDRTQSIMILMGVLVPIITAFLGAAVQQVHVAVNSRSCKFQTDRISAADCKNQQQQRLH